IDVSPEAVVFAPDIGFYEERKLRLLNATHTAMAPLALLASVRTVREAVEHPRLSAFLRRLLFDEIIPATNLPGDAAHEFAPDFVEATTRWMRVLEREGAEGALAHGGA